jgi:citrate synthase
MTDAILDYPGGQMKLPLRQSVQGAAGLDVSALAATSGYVTFDPGLANTATCASAITYIDRDAPRSRRPANASVHPA